MARGGEAASDEIASGEMRAQLENARLSLENATLRAAVGMLEAQVPTLILALT